MRSSFRAHTLHLTKPLINNMVLTFLSMAGVGRRGGGECRAVQVEGDQSQVVSVCVCV